MKACLLVVLGIMLVSAGFAEEEPSYSDRNALDGGLPDLVGGDGDEVLCCAGFGVLLTLLLAAGWSHFTWARRGRHPE